MNHCQDCRFWLMGNRHRYEVLLDLGICGKAPDFIMATQPDGMGNRKPRDQYKNNLAFVRSDADVGRLLTARDYGCPQWEAQILQELPHD